MHPAAHEQVLLLFHGQLLLGLCLPELVEESQIQMVRILGLALQRDADALQHLTEKNEYYAPIASCAHSQGPMKVGETILTRYQHNFDKSL